MNRDWSNEDANELLSRGIFLRNLFSGSKLASSFEQVRGYTPAVLGLPQTFVPQQLLDAHKEQEATRALERTLRARRPHTVTRTALPPGTEIWFYHHSSKNNEPNCWLRAKVIKATEHIVYARRTSRGPPLQLAYEDIRITPNNELAQQLLRNSLEEALLEDPVSLQLEKGIQNPRSQDTSHTSTDQLNISTENNQKEPENLAAENSINEPAAQKNSSKNPASHVEQNILPCTSPTKKAESTHTAPRNETSRKDPLTFEDNLPVGGVEYTNGDVAQPAQYSNMMSAPVAHAYKDIGTTQISPSNPRGMLKSHKQEVLNMIHKTIGTTTVTYKALEFAPPWITDESFQKEFEDNWINSFEPISEAEVPRNKSNIVTCHTLYRIKQNEHGERKLKARIVPHGNRDKEKHNIRGDSAAVQFDAIRLTLSMASIRKYRLALVDIKGAFMQSGNTKRRIYVRPPREWKGDRGILWKLIRLPYGIKEAGRQWMLTCEAWLLN